MGREILKKARKEKGLTQKYVAKYLNMELSSYKAIEGGWRTGYVEMWDKLEDLFNIHQRQLRLISDQEGNP